MFSVIKKTFLSFFSILIYVFSCLNVLIRTSKIIFYRNGNSKHLLLVLDLKERAFNFKPLSVTFAVIFLKIFFTQLKKSCSILSLLIVSNIEMFDYVK